MWQLNQKLIKRNRKKTNKKDQNYDKIVTLCRQEFMYEGCGISAAYGGKTVETL